MYLRKVAYYMWFDMLYYYAKISPVICVDKCFITTQFFSSIALDEYEERWNGGSNRTGIFFSNESIFLE